MKLNPDCIRDVLLYVEGNTSLQEFVYVGPDEIPSELSCYSPDEVMYHIKQAELSRLIDTASWDLDGGCIIKYLLPEGHQFLSNIHEENNWKKTKEIAKAVGSNSLDVLKDIASNVIATLIQSHLRGGL